jgi:aspartyl-tRNA(Asn)/glutamyl-tRNA(Gln) amidotransferase subunit C
VPSPFALRAASRRIFAADCVLPGFGSGTESSGKPPHSKKLAMPETSGIDVAYVAKLARLNLSDEEAQLFQKQLGDVLKYAEKLREVNVSHVEAAAHAIPVFNVFREDEPRDWFTAEQALSNAPRKVNNLFIVPKVVE